MNNSSCLMMEQTLNKNRKNVKMMKVKINNLKEGVVYGNKDTFEAISVSKDPERKYAVVGIQQNEIYFALKIISEDDDILVGEYVGHYESYADDPMLMRYRVDWEFINLGFAKLVLWAPEMVIKWNGCIEKTVKRFYFDWELYKKKYEEKNGALCPPKNQ